MPNIKIALAQINPVVGDLEANIRLITEAAQEAWLSGADIVITPELALSGYSPEDLLLRPGFLQDCDLALQALIAQTRNITLVVGHPEQIGNKCFNCASVIQNGEKILTYHKQFLPNVGVFDEVRYFTPGHTPAVFELKGVRCAIGICEDVWVSKPARLAREAGADLFLVLNASPYGIDKNLARTAVSCHRVTETGMPVVYVNMVGGQDELLFDGGSFALDRTGAIMSRQPLFETGISVVEYRNRDIQPGAIAPILPDEAEVYKALVLGVRDYVLKNHFPGVLVGLSGGIDSALTLCIAVDALGAEKVQAVMMPSPYTAQMSLDDSRTLVKNLGIQYDEIPIQIGMESFATMLAPHFSGLPDDVTEENIQARVRGSLLMALSNKTGRLVLTTGNKSEIAVGYCTLYGDMAGGFAVLKDVYKTLVYRLAHYRNRLNQITALIPDNIITRPPSAELRPGQTDQDSLPPYDILDEIIAGYVEENLDAEDLVALGFSEETVTHVIRLINMSEYKRYQAPIGIRITARGFGKDWRYPVTNRYRRRFQI